MSFIDGTLRRDPAHGFTLLEMLVVVGIIATLSSIAWPLWRNHVTISEKAVLIANIQSMAFFQESYKLRHGVYAVGLLDGEEIADRIGWSVGREGNTSFVIPDSDGSYYQVQAVNPNGVAACLQMPSRQRCSP